MAHFASRITLVGLLSLSFLTACQQEQGSSAGLAPPPPVVTVQTIKATELTLEQSLPGRVQAALVSEVRPQVSGIMQERLFIEGQDVQAGQILYQIDAAPYEASLQSAKAALAQAEAQLLAAKPKAARYQELLKINSISQQEYDEASAAYAQAQAQISVAQANIQQAQINLDYTQVKAPISGRIGASSFTPGALVTANQQGALATVMQLDPVFVDVTQTSAQILTLKKNIASGMLKAVDGAIPVKLILEDNSVYPHLGTLQFIDTAVSTHTGNVQVRVSVPNPDHWLLPGAYIRAVLPTAIHEQAILVPQQTVLRNTKGEAYVKLAVDGQVQERVVKLGDAVHNQWVITAGLTAGDLLIVEGGAKTRHGQQAIVEYATGEHTTGQRATQNAQSKDGA